MRAALVLLALLSLSSALLRPVPQGTGPKVPPDIQKLIDKANKGGKLTPAELQKLQDYSSAIAAKASSGKSAVQATQFIPCEVIVKGSYDLVDPEVKDHYEFNMRGRARLFARLNGNGDFSTGLTDPNAKASSFTFAPDVEYQGTTPVLSGSGSWTRSQKDAYGESRETNAKFKNAAIGLVLVSTGRGDGLFPLPGSSVDGVSTGTVTIRRPEQETETVSVEEGGSPPLVTFPFPVENDMDWQPGQPIPTSFAAKASLNALTSALIAKGAGTVTLSETFDFKTRSGSHVRGSSTVTIVIRGGGDLRLDVTVDNYDTWLPTGHTGGEDTPGNNATVRVKLVRKDGKPLKPSDKARKIRFNLVDTSREPGTSMNFPSAGNTGKPDMIIDWDGSKELKTSKDGQSAETTAKDLSGTYAVLESYDWGANTTLKVVAETPQGPVEGILKGTVDEKEIRIPKRDKGKWIPEAWAKKEGVLGSDDDADDENEPIGDGHKGDGYTLWEEYRGFYEDGKHIRGNPKKKDLMIAVERNKGNYPRILHGAELARDASGLAIHYKFKGTEFGPIKNGAFNAILNFNHAKGPHLADQHGVAILDSPLVQGFAGAYSKNGLTNHDTPGDFRFIKMTADWDPTTSGWTTIKVGKAQIKTDLYAVTVAHEILHTCAVRHHGETDTKRVKIEPNAAGTSLQMSKPGPNATAQAPDWQPSTPIRVFEYTTQSAEILPKDPRWAAWGGSAVVYLGVSGGQHSGFEDCIMRYVAASGHEHGGHVYFHVDGPGSADFTPELPGIGICDTKVGSGLNLASNRPHSKYGDATLGDCKHQICVNDRH